MKSEKVRIRVDIPAPLYRRLKQQAAAEGCSAEELIIRGVEQVLLNPRPSNRRRLQFPLIRSKGPPVPFSNEEIYERVQFP